MSLPEKRFGRDTAETDATAQNHISGHDVLVPIPNIRAEGIGFICRKE